MEVQVKEGYQMVYISVEHGAVANCPLVLSNQTASFT